MASCAVCLADNGNPAAFVRDAPHSHPSGNLHSFLLQDLPDRERHFRLVSRQDPGAVLQDCDCRSEALKHLAQLQRDVAPADDHQGLGEFPEFL